MSGRSILNRTAIYGALFILLCFFLLPFWVMLVASLKSMAEIRQGNIFAWPLAPSLDNWRMAWSAACIGVTCDGISAGFLNSLRIMVPSVILSVLAGSLNGFSLTFYETRRSGFIVAALVFCAFLPFQIFTYPLVRAFSVIGIFGTYPCIVIVHVLFGIPLTTLLFRSYYGAIPAEVVRAAQIDGAGYWAIYRHVVAPLSLPAFAVVTILQSTGIWNDFYLGLVFAGSQNVPMTVQLNNVVNTTTGFRDYGVDMAATLLTGAVPFLICILSGRWFVRALTSGAIKG